MTELPHPRIDAHLHLWDRTASEYRWISPDLGEIDADFAPTDALAELNAAGIDQAILVQADDSAADTHFMLDVAASYSWVVGVIGWVPLLEPDVAAAALEKWCENPLFRGVRQLVHIDPRDDLLDSPAVIETLRRVAERGLAFDVPNAWPRHLPSVARIAATIPTLTVVVDHLGSPPADPAALNDWKHALRDVASRPNTVAKVSGLQHLSAEHLHQVWDIALDTFGAHRLAYGGDWPMTLPYGGYLPMWGRISDLISQLSPAEQADILCQTATRTYHLPQKS